MIRRLIRRWLGLHPDIGVGGIVLIYGMPFIVDEITYKNQYTGQRQVTIRAINNDHIKIR